MQTQTLLRCLVRAMLAAVLVLAQTELDRPDPLIAAIQDSSSFVVDILAKAGDQICEEDYVAEPTAEGCRFGRLLAHLAEANYVFCSLTMAKRMIEFIIGIAISDR